MKIECTGKTRYCTSLSGWTYSCTRLGFHSCTLCLHLTLLQSMKSCNYFDVKMGGKLEISIVMLGTYQHYYP